MSSPTDKFVKITSVNKQLDQAITDGDVTTKTVAATLSNKTLDDSNTINVNETKLTLEKDGDPTAQAQFTLVNISSATIRRMELPDQDTSLVGTDVSQTLSQKTLDYTNTINIKDTNLTVQSSGDDTKKVRLSASSVSAGTTRTLTAPDANTTIVGTNASQTLSNKTIDNTNSVSIRDANLIIQNSSDTTKQARFNLTPVSPSNTIVLTVPTASTTIVGTGSTQTLTNKTLDNTSTITVKAANLTVQDATDTTKQIKLDASAVTTGTTRTLTAPDANTTIVGTDTTQTLSNKTLDDTSIVTVKGSNLTIEDATDVTKAIRFSAASITTGQRRILTAPDANTTIVGTGVAQTLTNKTVGDALTLTQVTTPSSPSSGLNKIYTKSNDSLYTLNSAGAESIIPTGTSAVKNYLGFVNNVNNNGNFELGTTTGWSLGTVGTLTNGIPTGSPTFGSGASGNLSISTVSSGQLAGAYSLSYASSTATTAGNMLASNAITIDTEDQAKVLTFKFYYKAQSGASNCNFSGTSSNSFGVAVYDVTNSAFLGVAGNFSMTQSSGVGIATGTFQTNATTAQIRFIVYNVNATAGAATIYFDDFYVGPQVSQIGPVITDWVSYTPTGSWTSNTTYTGKWRRVGDTMELTLLTSLVGAPNATALTINLPPGYSIDTTKLDVSGSPIIGKITSIRSGSNTYEGSVRYQSTTSVGMWTNTLNATSSNTHEPLEQAIQLDATHPATFGNGDTVNAFIWGLPIVGWSSNVQMSNDTDTRVVAFAADTSTTSATANVTTINFTNVLKDTHAAYSAGIYTVPVSGWYQTFGQTYSVTAHTTYVYINGSQAAQGTPYSSSSMASSVTLLRYLNAGDTIQIRVDATATLAGGSGLNRLNIFRLSGPSQIAASESVSAKYNTTATTAIAYNGNTELALATKIWDTHGAYNTSTGRFTAPISGKYRMTAMLTSNSVLHVSGGIFAVEIFKNGALDHNCAVTTSFGAITAPNYVSGSGVVQLLAGETMSLGYYNSFKNGSVTLNGEVSGNWVVFERIGN